METYKPIISKANAEKLGLPEDWNLAEFTFHNPTAAPFSFPLFNQNNVANYPTTPADTFPSTLNNIPSVGNFDAIAWNSVSNTIYMHDSVANVVMVINPLTLAVITTIPAAIGAGLIQMAYSPVDNRMFLLAPSLNQYWVINCATNTVISTLPLGGTGRGITYNSTKNTFYVNSQTTLYEIDSTTQAIVFSVALGGNMGGSTFVTSKNDMYISQIAGSLVIDFDCVTNTVTGTISVANPPFAVAYNSLKDTVYVGANNVGDIQEINVVTNTLLSTNIVKTNRDLIYIPSANVMYGNNGTHFYIIDCDTNNVVNDYPLSGGTNFFAADPVDNRVFCSGSGVNRYYVFTQPAPRFYITGSDDYNEWVADTFDNPMTVRRVQYISENSTNFSQVLNKASTDATGNDFYIPLIPQLSVCINMYQGSIAQMEFQAGHLILGKGGDFFSGFTVDSLSEIKVLVWFKQVDIGAQLTSTRTRETVFDKLSMPRTEPKLWTEEELTAPQIPVMHPVSFREWTQLEEEKASRPILRKITSRPLVQEIIEYETKVYTGAAIVEDPEKLEFEIIKPKYIPVNRKMDKVEYEDIEYETENYGSRAIVEDASKTEFHYAKPKHVAKKRRQDEVEYEDIEFDAKVYAKQAIVPFGSEVEYEQIETTEITSAPKEDEVFHDEIEIETEVPVGAAIIEEPCNIIIEVVGDANADELISKLKAANSRNV